MPNEINQVSIEAIYREEWGRIVAILIRQLSGAQVSSFELAEEAAQEAFAAALAQWPLQGIPASPRAWLIATARHKAIDALRRQSRFADAPSLELVADAAPATLDEAEPVEDDRLRLIFTCCHPALGTEAQVALTLRTLCGLTTDQIAAAFLVPLATMAQRLVRARAKIRDARIPYRTPPIGELAERLASVLLVVYLVFNQGYNRAAEGRELCEEAIRLARLLASLMPAEAEVKGILALMLLHHARRPARTSAAGDLVLLDEQDRGLWMQDEIAEGLSLAEQALIRSPGPYSVQAAIAALHMRAVRAEETDWPQIVALYDVLMRMHPSPVIALNRAAAVAMARGPQAGLLLLDALAESGELESYAPFYSARGALLIKLEQWPRAADDYRRALELTGDEAERRFLQRRLAEAEAHSE